MSSGCSPDAMDIGEDELTADGLIRMDEGDEYGDLYTDLELNEEAEAELQAIEHANDTTLLEPNSAINFSYAATLDATPALVANDDLPNNTMDGEELFIQGGLAEDENDDDRVPVNGSGSDDEESDEETEGAPEKRTRQHIPLPPWLMDAYKKCVEECRDRDKATNRPLLYRQGTFWFPVKNNFFALEAAKLKPSDLYPMHFFLWDPECLLPRGTSLVCRCKQRLTRMGAATRPRSVVGTEGLFYIIAFRYRCNACTLPTAQMEKISGASKSKGGKTSSFSSTSEHIMSQLPLHLTMEFPAILTHRQGISKELFALMRSCFHTNGMGSKQFADILRVNASRRYDEMDLRYHAGIVSRRKKGSLISERYPKFPGHNDQTPEGLHDYSPSSQLLQDIYDKLIESYEGDIDKLMSMVKVTVAGVDHSHKIIKYIFTLNGVPIYIGLYSMTNELSQLRVCDLVATKAHSQIEPHLHQVREALNLYGFQQPEIIYTDNMSDASLLHTCFPSLLRDVVPVEKHAHLPDLKLPNNWTIHVYDTVPGIEQAVRTIMEGIPSDEEATVGFDMEWNVQIGHGTQQREVTALIQIAHQNTVYLLRVDKLLSKGTLPQFLRSFLADKHIKKAGVGVAKDLKMLAKECQSTVSFEGALELALLAKELSVTSNSNLGLSDLCAAVLKQNLPKNIPERISSQWTRDDLTVRQQNYAALDAYASLAIYDVLCKIPQPEPLLDNLSPGLNVLLYPLDMSRPVAQGHLWERVNDRNIKSFGGITLSGSTTVVTIDKVLVPGAKARLYGDQTLSDFGKTPFHLVWHQGQIKVLNNSELGNIDLLDLPMESTSVALSPNAATSVVQGQEPESQPEPTEVSVREVLQKATGDSAIVSADHLTTAEADPRSKQLGEEIWKILESEFGADKERHGVIRSRVLKDPWHVLDLIYIPRNHGLAIPFALAMRDAFFIPDPEDKIHLELYASKLNPPQTWSDLVALRSDWTWQRCKRTIPPPDELYQLVSKVFSTYGPLKDAKTGHPLFNAAAWKMSKSVLQLIRLGHVSDPPGIPLYYQVHIDRNGFPIYRCIRGTNMVEGGVHRHLRDKLPKSGVSIRHMLACLKDFVLRHNLLVGTFNSTGHKYQRHYDIWTINKLQEVKFAAQDYVVGTEPVHDWINVNLYQNSGETFGIQQIPPKVREAAGLSPYKSTLDSKRSHSFLAARQGTRIAVLPIHTPDEKALFSRLMKGETTGKPCWSEITLNWNRKAESSGDSEIYYKLSEHLEAYFKGSWQSRLNQKLSMHMSVGARQSLKTVLDDPRRAHTITRTEARPQPSIQVTSGFLPIEPGGTIMSTQPTESPGAGPSTSPMSVSNTLLHKRGLELLTPNVNPPAKKQRKKRTCQKCGKKGGECPGSGNRSLCKGKCQDCGDPKCNGREEKKPGLKCPQMRGGL